MGLRPPHLKRLWPAAYRPACAASAFTKMEGSFVGKKLLEFLTVPSDLRPEFWRESVQKNRLSLLVICIMMLRLPFRAAAGTALGGLKTV